MKISICHLLKLFCSAYEQMSVVFFVDVACPEGMNWLHFGYGRDRENTWWDFIIDLDHNPNLWFRHTYHIKILRLFSGLNSQRESVKWSLVTTVIVLRSIFVWCSNLSNFTKIGCLSQMHRFMWSFHLCSKMVDILWEFCDVAECRVEKKERARLKSIKFQAKPETVCDNLKIHCLSLSHFLVSTSGVDKYV